MTIRPRTIIVLLSALLWGVASPSAKVQAQSWNPGNVRTPTVPQPPPLSPYLNLLRSDNSLLSPYHTFVVPQRQMQYQQNFQAREISRLQQATFGSHQPHSGGAPNRLPTGTGGHFQTYLHFYGFNSVRPQ